MAYVQWLFRSVLGMYGLGPKSMRRRRVGSVHVGGLHDRLA